MNEGPVILIIDDEVQIRRMLRLSLDAHGYQVCEATTSQEGLDQAATRKPDLIILDLGLPDTSGLETLKRLREWTRIPVIILSVKNSEQDKIDLLDSGADDYLTKPFSMGELLARIRAALRHSVPDSSGGVITAGDLVIDFVKRSVSRNGEEIKLTPTEYSIMKILASNSGRVLTHNQIMDELVGLNAHTDSSYLRVFVMQLRKKIEKDPSNPGIILTEPGVGYRMIEE